MSPGALPPWQEMIGLLGGRFDPPHRGHAQAIAGVLKDPGLREVWVLPSGNPTYKPTQASATHREALCRLLVKDPSLPPARVRVETCELDRQKLHPTEPTYSFETLQELRARLGQTQMAFVLGTDQFSRIESWHRFPDVLKACNWVVLQRKGEPPETVQELLSRLKGQGLVGSPQRGAWPISITGAPRWVGFFETEAPALSSTQIRESLARTGNPPSGALGTEVIDYLKAHRLYGMPSSHV